MITTNLEINASHMNNCMYSYTQKTEKLKTLFIPKHNQTFHTLRGIPTTLGVGNIL